MKSKPAITLVLCAICLCADKPARYTNGFEKANVGAMPEDLMVLNGTFAVRQLDGNKFLELAGDPIDSDGFLFGPAGVTSGEVGARIWAGATGRRFPEFGIGSNDVAGYKLWIEPGQARMELRKGEQTRASVPFRDWKSGTWTELRLRVGKTAAGKWKIEGKAWPHGAAEARDWMISIEDRDAPAPGRASAWGTPYSEQPIRFDDLSVSPAQ